MSDPRLHNDCDSGYCCACEADNGNTHWRRKVALDSIEIELTLRGTLIRVEVLIENDLPLYLEKMRQHR